MRSSMSPIILGRQSRGSIASCAALHCDMNSRESETTSSVEDAPLSRRSQSPEYARAWCNRGPLLLKPCLAVIETARGWHRSLEASVGRQNTGLSDLSYSNASVRYRTKSFACSVSDHYIS